MARELKTSLRTKTSLKAQLIARLKFSSLLSLPEKEFAKVIAEIEGDPIFHKLVYPNDAGPKAIFRKRFAQSRLSQSFYDVKEEINAGSESVDVQAIVEKHGEIVQLIRKIGQPNFEKYFLYREGSESLESIAENCGLAPAEVMKVQALITELSVHSEFFHPSALQLEGQIHYTLIAKIEPNESGTFSLSYFSPHLASGRYVINQDRVEAIRRFMSPSDKKSLSDLIRRIELANLRYDTVQKMVAELVLRQDSFLRSGSYKQLLPLSQREVAQRISVAPSTICRAVYGKSVILPWGEEKPLKDLFMNRKRAAERWVAEILQDMPPEEKSKLSDNQLREMLLGRYRLKVSRRSVNLYRRAVEKNLK